MLGAPSLTRRQLLVASGTFAGYALSVETVLAQAIKTDTTGLVASEETVKVADGHDMPVYEARPASGTAHPIVLVVSEVWGVHEYIRDVTRRFAKEGYHAVAPELFARQGGTAQLTNLQDVLKVVLGKPREQTLGDTKAAVDWAKTRPGARRDRIGVTGFCWGGSTVIQIAATNKDMKAAVSWYGPPGRPYDGEDGPVTGFELAKDVNIPFLGLYGGKDTNPSPDDAKRFIELVRQHNPNVDMKLYDDAGHGFHADYRPSYNPAAAQDGWKRCLAWFRKYVA